MNIIDDSFSFFKNLNPITRDYSEQSDKDSTDIVYFNLVIELIYRTFSLFHKLYKMTADSVQVISRLIIMILTTAILRCMKIFNNLNLNDDNETLQFNGLQESFKENIYTQVKYFLIMVFILGVNLYSDFLHLLNSSNDFFISQYGHSYFILAASYAFIIVCAQLIGNLLFILNLTSRTTPPIFIQGARIFTGVFKVIFESLYIALVMVLPFGGLSNPLIAISFVISFLSSFVIEFSGVVISIVKLKSGKTASFNNSSHSDSSNNLVETEYSTVFKIGFLLLILFILVSAIAQYTIILDVLSRSFHLIGISKVITELSAITVTTSFTISKIVDKSSTIIYSYKKWDKFTDTIGSFFNNEQEVANDPEGSELVPNKF